MEMIRWATKIDAGNDTNGNPRRAYLVYEMDADYKIPQLVETIDEGYAGISALHEKYLTVDVVEPTLKVTPKTYKELLKEYMKK